MSRLTAAALGPIAGPPSSLGEAGALHERSPSIGKVEDSFSAHFHSGRSEAKPDGNPPVEGLRTCREVHHTPVMLAEVLDCFRSVPHGWVLDATVGGGGHAEALLEAFIGLRLIGLDRDPEAVAAAKVRLASFGERAVVRHARFEEGEPVAAGPLLVGALFDLGVSSDQIDDPSRGFSYRLDGPLDMRMDRTQALRAADLLESVSFEGLVELLSANGEERHAPRIARAVLAARPYRGTSHLAAVVERAVPSADRRRGHPASRVFQALRTEVNGELGALGSTLDGVIRRLVPGGRCVVLAYQSNEDRLVKAAFTHAATGGCRCPAVLGCVCGARPWARLLNRRARRPSPAEVVVNPRASAARLRALERLEPEA